MGQDLQVPDSFKNRQMSPAFQAALGNRLDDSLDAGIGQSYAVIGYTGKIWSLRHRGERKTFVRPDDGTPCSYLDVVILGQATAKSKSFYKKFDMNTSAGERPICSSMDGVVPDADVSMKQHDNCALCPRNQWKPDPATGRKGKECTDYKRLAVLVMPAQTKAILGTPLLEPVFLRVPPDSLNSLAIMGETMTAQQQHYSSYVTRITFDEQKPHPCMQFRPLNPLTDADFPVIRDLIADPTVGRITGGDLAARGLRAVAQALAPAAAGNALTAAVTPAPVAPVAPAPALTLVPQMVAPVGLAQPVGTVAPAPALTLVQAAPPPAPPASLVSTGIAEAATAQAAQVGTVVRAPAQSVSDVGEAEASDDDLDARMAKMIHEHATR